jgi:hypothetical protein
VFCKQSSHPPKLVSIFFQHFSSTSRREPTLFKFESYYGFPSLDKISFLFKEHSFYSTEDLNCDLEAGHPSKTLLTSIKIKMSKFSSYKKLF